MATQLNIGFVSELSGWVLNHATGGGEGGARRLVESSSAIRQDQFKCIYLRLSNAYRVSLTKPAGYLARLGQHGCKAAVALAMSHSMCRIDPPARPVHFCSNFLSLSKL